MTIETLGILGVFLLVGIGWLLTRRTSKDDEKFGEGKSAHDYYKEMYRTKDTED